VTEDNDYDLDKDEFNEYYDEDDNNDDNNDSNSSIIGWDADYKDTKDIHVATEMEQNVVCLHCIPKAHEQHKKIDKILLENADYEYPVGMLHLHVFVILRSVQEAPVQYIAAASEKK